MNKVKIGREFEEEANDYLKDYFDEVEWLSKKQKTPFDFKCTKDGKIYFGDAKVKTNGKPTLNFSQKEADFVVAKLNGKIKLFYKEEFKENINIKKERTYIITIQDKTWEYLNKLKKAGESFDEVIKRQLKIIHASDQVMEIQNETN